MFKSLAFLFLTLSPGVLLLAAPPAAQQDELPDNPVVEHLRAVTVTVQTQTGSGSGCVIVRGKDVYVLTAGHVVESLRKSKDDNDNNKKVTTFEDCKVLQKIVQDGRTTRDVSYDAEVLRFSNSETGEDLAVLRLYDKGSFKDSTAFYLGKKIPPVGTRLLHAGSPLGDIGAGSVIPGFYSAHGRMLEKHIYDQISCSAFPGSSGGAVCLEDGRWVGAVLRGKDGGFILIRPVRILRQWAKKVGVEFLLDPSLPVPSNEDLGKQPVEAK